MKFELKNFKHYPRISEETIAFSADLYIDGVKAASCENTGKGGCTNIRPYQDKRELLKEAEKYAASLPTKEYDFMNEHFSTAQSVESIVDDLVSDILEKKEIEKHQKRKFVITKDDKMYTVALPNKYTIEELLKVEQGREYIRKEIEDFVKDGYKVVNLNIPDEYK